MRSLNQPNYHHPPLWFQPEKSNHKTTGQLFIFTSITANKQPGIEGSIPFKYPETHIYTSPSSQMCPWIHCPILTHYFCAQVLKSANILKSIASVDPPIHQQLSFIDNNSKRSPEVEVAPKLSILYLYLMLYLTMSHRQPDVDRNHMTREE